MPRTTTAKLPSKLTLPSGTVLRLRGAEPGRRAPLARTVGAPLFAEVEAAIAEGRVILTREGAPLALGSLVLRDFHVLRAILARSAVTAEEELTIACRNCGETMRVRPCAALEIGPWVDGELGDAELDATLPLGGPVDLAAPVPLGRVRTARTATFEERTVAEARPLFAAAAKQPLEVTAAVVQAMGLVALGAEKDATRIAEALATCDDAAFGAVGDAFVESHYPARLGSVVRCEACGARNDVDAPFERELGGDGGEARGEARGTGKGAFPGFEGFAARARAIADEHTQTMPGEPVELVVEGTTPMVDEGGEPLLGSYEPPHPGDAALPSRSPTVTVYYRTFAAMWNEEGPYDWEEELAETLAHELEHHIAFMRGDDPTDEEERALIRDEAVRLVGRREAGRRALEEFGASWRDFSKRTWPLWLLALVALAAMLLTQR